MNMIGREDNHDEYHYAYRYGARNFYEILEVQGRAVDWSKFAPDVDEGRTHRRLSS